MKGIRVFAVILLSVLGFLLPAAVRDTLWLVPGTETECGIFRNRLDIWSLAEESRIRLSYDKENIWLKAELKVPAGKNFSGRGRKDDDLEIFSGSVFEFQLAPSAQKGIYYHFGLSPAGKMYSARKRDLKWNSPLIKYSSSWKIGSKVWSFTLKVPFKAIGEKCPEGGTKWRVHMGKSIPTAYLPVEHTSISGAADYHTVSQYADLVFGKKAPLNESVRLVRVIPGKKGFDFYFAAEKAVDGAKGCYVWNMISSKGAVSLEKVAGNVPGHSFYKAHIPLLSVLLKGNIRQDLSVKDGNDRILFCRSGVLPVEHLVSVNVDRFYYTADQKIVYTHTFPGKADLKLIRDGKVFSLVKNAPRKGALDLRQKKLQPGRYVMTVSDDTHKAERILFVLGKEPSLPPLKKGVPLKIRQDLTFSLGGEALYLLGLSRARVFVPYKNVYNLKYNPAGARENAVVMPSMPGARLIRRPFTGRVYGNENAFLKRIGDYAAKLDDTKKGAFHLLSYEAQIASVVKDHKGRTVPGSPADLMRRSYRAAKNITPSSFYSIHVDRPDKIPFYTGSCDIFQSAYWSSSYAVNMIPDMAKDLENLRSLVKNKPLIFWLGGTVPNHSCRTEEEIRCGVYLSILKGMAGNIIHMGHEAMPASRTRMWSLLGGLPVEIEGFYKDFASGKDVETSKIRQGSVLARVKVLPNGEKMILAVNQSAGNSVFTISGKWGKNVRLYPGGGILSLKKEKNSSFWTLFTPDQYFFEDTLQGYEPKVYYLKD